MDIEYLDKYLYTYIVHITFHSYLETTCFVFFRMTKRNFAKILFHLKQAYVCACVC